MSKIRRKGKQKHNMYFKLVDKFWHVIAILRIIWLRIVSCGSINISTTAMFRKGFTILTSGGAKLTFPATCSSTEVAP